MSAYDDIAESIVSVYCGGEEPPYQADAIADMKRLFSGAKDKIGRSFDRAVGEFEKEHNLCPECSQELTFTPNTIGILLDDLNYGEEQTGYSAHCPNCGWSDDDYGE